MLALIAGSVCVPDTALVPDQPPLAVHLVANAYWEALEFALPSPPIGTRWWRLLVDTWRDAPDDVSGPRIHRGDRQYPNCRLFLAFAQTSRFARTEARW